jgi:hypothetical protein
MNEDTPYTELGATAHDDRDGVVNAVIYSGYVRTWDPGTYSITYRAEDLAGHVSYAYRTIKVLDVTPPTITMRGEPTVVVFKGNSYNDAGAYANDNKWWYSRSVYGTSNVNTNVAGNYTVTYNISDYAGNAATTVTRTVVVKDPTQ